MQSKVPFLDISIGHKVLKDEILRAIDPIIDSGNFISGQAVEELENQIASYCGTRYAVSVNSGTDALILSLKALNIGKGDEVITSAHSFIATIAAISWVGATPVLVDIDETYNIDPNKLEQALSKNTKAILPVHYTGRIADMNQIIDIANKHSIPVIEDAAQAMGAEYRGRKAGSFGCLGCFSFFPTKNLSCCGDGGIITTNDKELYEKLKLLRNFGRYDRDSFVIKGINSRLDTIQAAILLVKLKYFDSLMEKRIKIAEYYSSELNGLVHVPKTKDYEKQVYHLYIICTDNVKNVKLQDYLMEQGIDTRIHYPVPMHLQKAYQDLGYEKGSFPVVESYTDKFLTLPVYPELTEEQIEYTVKTVKNFFQAENLRTKSRNLYV